MEGDLVELYELRLEKMGARKARWRFAWDVLKSFRIINFKRVKIFIMSQSLFKHTFKTGYRQIVRNKFFSAINIAGLGLSITAFLLISLFVYDEASFDTFHQDSERIYRVLKTDSLQTEPWAYNPPALGPSLVSEYPEISASIRVFYMQGADLKHAERTLPTSKGLAVDSTFFTFFDFPIVAGHKPTLLAQTRNIVISEQIADAYFPEVNPIGETVTIHESSFVIAGVVKVPVNSHLQFDWVFPLTARIAPEYLGIWKQSFLYTYVKAEHDVRLADKIWNQMSKHEPTNRGIKITLQPLSDIHLNPKVSGMMSVAGNKLYVQIFSIAGWLVLLIAAINYMNLNVGRATERVKEVGVRKVLGANRGLVAMHFIGEGLLLIGTAAFLGLFFAWQLLPMLNDLTGKSFDLISAWDIITPQRFILGTSLVISTLAILSALYPAILLSNIKPTILLKGWLGKRLGSQFFGSAMTSFQFGTSTVLVICALIVMKQLNFLENKPLGWDKNNLVSLKLKAGMFDHYETFKDRLMHESSIDNVTWVSELPIDVRTGGVIEFEGMNPEKQYAAYYINGDENFYETFRLEAVEGIPFRAIHDESKKHYVINEALLNYLREEWGPDVNPIGKELDGGLIVGVVKNYHWQPMTKEIGPILYGIDASDSYGSANEFVVRVKDGQLTAGLKSIESIYLDIYPGFSFDYRFVDEQMAALYTAESNTSRLLISFSFLAIFISCLGMLGLAYQAINKQLKALSIRKVMGASSADLFLRFFKQFGVVFAVAIGLAIPFSIWLSNQWMSSFAYLTNIGWFTYIIGSVLVLTIVSLTILVQFRRALHVNPATILRDE
ncbi:MAG: ABC transporter permease [Cyclobacteriaceae bacterium]